MVVERTPFPSPTTGYPLAPGQASGLFSFVLTDHASQVVNLNDIGCYVVAYRGGGLPTVRNLYNQVATTGKTQSIKTLVNEQTLELTVAAMLDKATGEDSLTALQRVLTTLALYLAPSESRQSAANLYIRYQSRGDDCQTRGVALQRLYKYVGGLDEYTLDSREQLRLNLRFESFEGSKWEEITDNVITFGASTSTTATVLTLNLSTGAVADATGSYASNYSPYRVFRDSQLRLWSGGSAIGGGSIIAGAVTYAGAESGGGYISSFAEFVPVNGDPHRVYAGKVTADGTATFLLRLTDGDVAWANVAGFNGSIYAVESTLNGAETLIVGNFTTPGIRLATINQAGTLDDISLDANAAVYSASPVAANRFVIGGAFTLLDATAVSKIAIIDTGGAVISTLAGGISETIYAVRALPNGNIYALGQSKVYFWDGSKWTNTTILGANTTAIGAVTAVNNLITLDKTTGEVYFAHETDNTIDTTNTYAVRRILRGIMGAPIGLLTPSKPEGAAYFIRSVSIYDRTMHIAKGPTGNSTYIKNAPVTVTYTGTRDQTHLTFEWVITDDTTVASSSNVVTSVFFQLKNWTTGKTIMVDLPQGILYPGQTLILKLNQNGNPAQLYTPDASGGVQEDFTRYIVAGSDVGTFALVRGVNYVELWGHVGFNMIVATSATLTYQNAHYGADGSVNQTVISVGY